MVSLANRLMLIFFLLTPQISGASNSNVHNLVDFFEEWGRPQEDNIIVGDPNRWQRPRLYNENQANDISAEEQARLQNSLLISSLLREAITRRNNLQDETKTEEQTQPPAEGPNSTLDYRVNSQVLQQQLLARLRAREDRLRDMLLNTSHTPADEPLPVNESGSQVSPSSLGNLGRVSLAQDYIWSSGNNQPYYAASQASPPAANESSNDAEQPDIFSQMGSSSEISEQIFNDTQQATYFAEQLNRYQAEQGQEYDIISNLLSAGGNSQPPPSLEFLADIKDMDEETKSKALGNKRPEAPREVMETVHTEIGKRMTMVSASNIAASAGEENSWQLDNIWVNGIYGLSKQNLYKGSPGYSGSLYGYSFGADLLLYDQLLLGLAYSRVFSDFKFKHTSLGDKLANNNHVLSLYSQWQTALIMPESTFIISSIVSGSLGKTKTKDIRPINVTTSKIAYGSFNNSSLSGEVELALHKQLYKNFAIRPSFGLRHVYYQDDAYQETGAGLHNFSFAKKSTTNTTNHLALKLMMPKQLDQNKSMVFAIDGAVIYQHDTSPQKVRSKLYWASDFKESTAFEGKIPRYSYSLGADILLKWNDCEFIFDYDYIARKAHRSHYTSLKFKYLF